MESSSSAPSSIAASDDRIAAPESTTARVTTGLRRSSPPRNRARLELVLVVVEHGDRRAPDAENRGQRVERSLEDGGLLLERPELDAQIVEGGGVGVGGETVDDLDPGDLDGNPRLEPALAPVLPRAGRPRTSARVSVTRVRPQASSPSASRRSEWSRPGFRRPIGRGWGSGTRSADANTVSFFYGRGALRPLVDCMEQLGRTSPRDRQAGRRPGRGRRGDSRLPADGRPRAARGRARPRQDAPRSHPRALPRV